jgi:hypothetical protein
MPLNLVSQIVDIKLHQMSEILNLEENKNILIKKALLKYKTQREAAEALGCSSKHLINKLKEFKLKKDESI